MKPSRPSTLSAVDCDTSSARFVGTLDRRAHGPAPTLANSEVLTMDVVGEFLGFDTDVGIHAYFRRHWTALFPALRQVHRAALVS